MGILGDVINLGKNIFRNTSKAADTLGKYNKKSFARGANDQTFQFPCIISDTIPIDMASTITRNLDRVYASFVQIYLSANGVVDLNYIRNPRQFVAQYKTNFSLESTDDNDFTEDEMDIIESVSDHYKVFYDGRPQLYLTDDESAGFLFTAAESVSLGMMKNLKEGMKEPLSDYDVSLGAFSEASSQQRKNDMMDKLLQNLDDDKTANDNKQNLDSTRYEQTPRLVERDIKKLNDMQPYALDLKFLATKGDTSFSQYITYTIGVKTTCHLGKSSSLITNIAHVLKNKNFMFNFIRWTTGELSLFKDIILNLNETNFNISNKSDKTGKMISKLKELKNRKVKVTSSGLSRIAPFATIVISNYEYNEILNNYGFDLKNVTFAEKVMKELFLMGFIIVDETTQTIDMILDGSTNGFQTYSLETLQREVTMNSNKLGQELSRMLGSSK